MEANSRWHVAGDDGRGECAEAAILPDNVAPFLKTEPEEDARQRNLFEIIEYVKDEPPAEPTCEYEPWDNGDNLECEEAVSLEPISAEHEPAIKKIKLVDTALEPNLQCLSENSTEACDNCIATSRRFQTKFDELQETVRHSMRNLKSLVEDRFQQLQTITISQNAAIMAALAEQKALTAKLVHQESAGLSIGECFPLTSEENLVEMNARIADENRNQYIRVIRTLLHDNLEKNLKHVLSDGIILYYNIDGTHSKKRLKSYENFYNVLLDAIKFLPFSGGPEEHLRKAIQRQKKRHFQRVCAKRELKT